MPQRPRPTTGTRFDVTSEVIPRAALVAVWVNEWVRGRTSAEALVDGISPFGPHEVGQLPDTRIGLVAWLSDIGVGPRHPTRLLRPALPVPGDPAGLPGPRELNEAAVERGQALLVDELGFALIPTFEFDKNGTLWTRFDTAPHVASQNVSRPESANTEIRAALLEATATIVTIARPERRDALGSAIDSLDHSLDRVSLPGSLSNRSRETLTRSALVNGICAIAAADLSHSTISGNAVELRDTITALSATARRCLAGAAVAG